MAIGVEESRHDLIHGNSKDLSGMAGKKNKDKIQYSVI
jgi:hypothetical protein